MSGPTLRTYKAGSIIYFIEDRGSEVFVLQKGRIVLISNSLDNATETKEDVQKGEFFGVKSALGMYPREETAQVLSDAVVLVFTPQMFEVFCMKNTRLVLQMLKVFSGQLRKVHRKVRELLGEAGQQENSIELLRTAESFYKSNEMDHASYAFKAFLKNYDNSPLKSRAQSMLNLISKNQPYPVEMDSIDSVMSKIYAGESDLNTNQFDLSNDNGYHNSMEPPPLENFSNADHNDLHDIDIDIPEMDIPDMDNSDMELPDMDLPSISSSSNLNTSAAAVAAAPPVVKPGISQLYYDGINEFSRQNWDAAIKKFEASLQQTKFENDAEASFIEKSSFELARTYLKKGDLNTSGNKFAEFVKKYPRSQNIKKAMMYIADIYEKKGDKQRAIALYNKVIGMPPRDKDSSYAKQQLDRLMK
ncbi:MAG: cyclic nucleotide-binding domain-containing protein [Spirochaetia bacterium]|nr:cyclic nucleotide-binding domain-containing protein [Spirochaetia bacterium]